MYIMTVLLGSFTISVKYKWLLNTSYYAGTLFNALTDLL